MTNLFDSIHHEQWGQELVWILVRNAQWKYYTRNVYGVSKTHGELCVNSKFCHILKFEPYYCSQGDSQFYGASKVFLISHLPICLFVHIYIALQRSFVSDLDFGSVFLVWDLSWGSVVSVPWCLVCIAVLPIVDDRPVEYLIVAYLIVVKCLNDQWCVLYPGLLSKCRSDKWHSTDTDT